jgi:hypothetical protein
VRARAPTRGAAADRPGAGTHKRPPPVRLGRPLVLALPLSLRLGPCGAVASNERLSGLVLSDVEGADAAGILRCTRDGV